jgi:hypothetical protein
MEGNMSRVNSAVLGLVGVLMVTGWAFFGSSISSAQTTSGSGPSLVGAWIVTASRPGGVGKNMLTFSSDGTFFRSGDTHPVVSGAHGAWKRVSDKEYHATYIAFRFDQAGKWIGSNVTRIRITLGPDGNEFTGLAKVSVRDLEDKEERTSESRLQGRRIQVEPF